MSRITLASFVFVYGTAFAVPRIAFAEERPPCSEEADAVKNMKTRDASLAYPKNPSAKDHLEAGRRAFGVQQFDKAIEEYTAAGLADDAPLILYNLGQTYRSAKEYGKAIRQYELFLERGKPGAEVRKLVTCHIDTMKRELDHAASTAPPTGPASEPSATQITPPTSTTTSNDETSTDTGTSTDAEPHGPSRWTGKRKAAVGLAVGGIAAVGVGTVFAMQNRKYKHDADKLCPSTPCANADEANALSDRAGTKATFANISFGVGAGLAVTAVVLWFVGAPSPTSDSAESALVPQITPTFSGIAYGGSF